MIHGILQTLSLELSDRTGAAKDRQASVCVVLRPSLSGGLFDLLYMVRSDAPGDYWAGQVGFPGGKKDPEDIDLMSTAEREFEEEMGDSIKSNGKFIGLLDSIQGRRSGKLMNFTIHPHVFFQETALEIEPDPAEVGSYFWIPAENILNPKFATEFSLDYDSGTINLPGIAFPERKTLWGITYMITRDLFLRLEKDQATHNRFLETSDKEYLQHLPPYPG